MTDDAAAKPEQPQPGAEATPPRQARKKQAGAGRKSGGGASGRQPVGGQRHQGRVLALQVLFEIDLTGHDSREAIAHTFADQAAPPPVRSHVERLVGGVVTHRDEIDPYITEAAPAFPLPQLAAVDRNVLRLAVYELLHEPGVPTKAVINEAIELAKRFGGDSSGRFVNGVLGTIAARVQERPERARAASPAVSSGARPSPAPALVSGAEPAHGGASQTIPDNWGEDRA